MDGFLLLREVNRAAASLANFLEKLVMTDARAESFILMVGQSNHWRS